MNELLRVQSVSKSYVIKRNMLGRPIEWNPAVRSVSFSLGKGATLALVGESGSGKSTIGKMVLRLLNTDAGRIEFDGGDIATLKGPEFLRWRRRTAMIFQDPFTSLDPRFEIGRSIVEPLAVHHLTQGRDRESEAAHLLSLVGLPPDVLHRYPREFSGGQLQRIVIARAIATNPDLIVCDEPVAALDVSIRAQVINLLRDLQRQRGISYLFISHDLSLVRAIAHDVAVMYRGELVEIGSAQMVFAEPQHPYTKALLEAIPSPHPCKI